MRSNAAVLLAAAQTLFHAVLLLPEQKLVLISVNPCPCTLPSLQVPPRAHAGCSRSRLSHRHVSLPCGAITGQGRHLLSRATEQKTALLFWLSAWIWGGWWSSRPPAVETPSATGLQRSVRMMGFVPSLIEAKPILKGS